MPVLPKEFTLQQNIFIDSRKIIAHLFIKITKEIL